MPGSRRKGRILALQALYEADTVQHEVSAILERSKENTGPSDDSWKFGAELARGVVNRIENIDRIIESYAPNWPISQLSSIDRNILRIAVYELTASTDTPPKAAANEAVELAKTFGSDSSQRFVNGVLGSLLAERNA